MTETERVRETELPQLGQKATKGRPSRRETQLPQLGQQAAKEREARQRLKER